MGKDGEGWVHCINNNGFLYLFNSFCFRARSYMRIAVYTVNLRRVAQTDFRVSAEMFSFQLTLVCSFFLFLPNQGYGPLNTKTQKSVCVTFRNLSAVLLVYYIRSYDHAYKQIELNS